jgi:RHS repeat-associated protein
VIGDSIIEARVNGKASGQNYLHKDYTHSVRVVTDQSGAVLSSLGYDGVWGTTRISGQSYASTNSQMENFYRYQGQEQEIFPLSSLGIEDTALEEWLDQVQLYHFPYREYSAGLAIFLSHDPAQQSISPYAAFAANPANFWDMSGAAFEWLRESPALKTFTFTLTQGFVYGATLGLAAYIMGEDASPWVSAAIGTVLFGLSRYAAVVEDNLLSIKTINYEGRNYLLQGPNMLYLRSNEDETDKRIRQLAQWEMVESIVTYALAITMDSMDLNSWELFGSITAIFTACGIVEALLHASYLRSKKRYGFSFQDYELADMTSDQRMTRLKFIAGEGWKGVLTYTLAAGALKFSFALAEKAESEPLENFIAFGGNLVWPIRNLLSRRSARLIENWINSRRPASLMILDFREGEREAIYWDPNKQRFYVMNYATYESRRNYGTKIYLGISQDQGGLYAERDLYERAESNHAITDAIREEHYGDLMHPDSSGLKFRRVYER